MGDKQTPSRLDKDLTASLTTLIIDYRDFARHLAISDMYDIKGLLETNHLIYEFMSEGCSQYLFSSIFDCYSDVLQVVHKTSK